LRPIESGESLRSDACLEQTDPGAEESPGSVAHLFRGLGGPTPWPETAALRWRPFGGHLFFIRHFPDFLLKVSFDVAIQGGQAAGARRLLDALNHFRGPVLLLDLLVDEPMHEHLRRIVLCRNRRLIDGIDPKRIGPFLGLRLLGDLEQGPELLLRRGHRCQFGRLAAVGQVFEYPLCVRPFLAHLLHEVFSEALQVLDVAPHG